MVNEKIVENIKLSIPKIVDKLVDYYGEKYRSVIEERVDNVKFIFAANPSSEYYAISKHPELFSEEEKNKIEEEYRVYRNLVEESLERSRTKLCIYLKEVFSKLGLEGDESLFAAFSDYSFEEGAIDSFSSESLSLLEREDVDDVVKETIIKKQNWMLDKWLLSRGITKEMAYKLSNVVDDFIKVRQEISLELKMWIVDNSVAGKYIKESIAKEIGYEADVNNIVPIFFRDDLCTLSWTNDSGEAAATGCILNCPWSTILLKDRADEILVHELIHVVESDGVTGITDENENNVIANEILTQMIAKKITKDLHDEGVCIINTVENVDKKSVCYYEYMFPLVMGFFSKHEVLLKVCKIENDLKTIEESFGNVWKTFSKRLDVIYDCMVDYWKNGLAGTIESDKECDRLIKAMERHYNSKNTKK